jgi:peptidoglycan/xylan/chitin deacetylase (PgdA/CDA1 family)
VISSVLEQIRKWAGTGAAQCTGGRPLLVEDIASLSQLEQIEIGAHTVNHGCLANLLPEAQRTEIEMSRTDLENLIGTTVSAFSYPNGSYNRNTLQIVAEAGFKFACTSQEGYFRYATDPFTIPRLWAPNLGAEEFEQWLSSWVKTGI